MAIDYPDRLFFSLSPTTGSSGLGAAVGVSHTGQLLGQTDFFISWNVDMVTNLTKATRMHQTDYTIPSPRESRKLHRSTRFYFSPETAIQDRLTIIYAAREEKLKTDLQAMRRSMDSMRNTNSIPC
ncbi:hypothetical protein PROFUN_07505 [Planoprotostelium fungivorum]|uniref:Uncharacterized protein n=1 Tax=Planoprotostelium fungivorum TaxID=1890364 RepID=A0A2P6NLL4_9EUKA|nr:hypothetical protein PROFUN_07505 [Planoprotostelium fungivorum]